jgi:hypothetical protein
MGTVLQRAKADIQQRQMFITTIAAESKSKPMPKGALSRRPHATFFSVAIIAAINSIHPTLPVPTRNIRSMIAQQQPTQNKPWCTPSRNDSHRSA